jgi:tripartite-type tricarboxylate transporter receptor subunit TctC
MSFLLPISGEVSTLGGRLDGLVGDIPTVMGQVRAGKLKALATSSKDRSDIFPDVPTFVEQGFVGVIGDNWAGVLAPAGTPASVIAKFNPPWSRR